MEGLNYKKSMKWFKRIKIVYDDLNYKKFKLMINYLFG